MGTVGFSQPTKRYSETATAYALRLQTYSRLRLCNAGPAGALQGLADSAARLAALVGRP